MKRKILPNEVLAQRLRKRRMEKGFSQEVLGDLIGLDAAFISRLESARKSIAVGNLVELANALECSTDYLLGLSAYTPRRVKSGECPLCKGPHELSGCPHWVTQSSPE